MTRAGWHVPCTSAARLERGGCVGNFFRTALAGWGAYKLGGGCISTILIFIVLYWILGAFC
jgi:hypothetical protein